jgi:dipeptidyl-peptidase-4
MRKYTFVLLLTFLPITLLCQNRVFTLEDCINMNPDLFPQTISNIQWIPGTDNYSFTRNDTLFMGNVKTDNESVITTATKVNSILKKSIDNETGIFSTLRSVIWTDNSKLLFTHEKRLYSLDTKKDGIKYVNSVPEGENIDISPDYDKYAFTKKNDLYIIKEGKEIPVALSEKPDVIYGTERAHRNEFGITKGTFWSPQSNYLAFYRMDESMVTDYPLLNIEGRIATADIIKYPMAGMTSHEVTLGIYNINTTETIYIKTEGETDQYLTLVTWDPSEKYIYIALLNRAQDHLMFNKYDIATGELVKTLFEETDDEYVEPQFNPTFLGGKPDQFIWQSRKDGWNHLYLYNTDGRFIKQLTTGEWEVTSIIGFTQKNDKVFFTSTKDSPIENNIYSVVVSNGKIQKLSADHGTHNGILSSDGNYLIDNFSSSDVVNRYNIIDTKGNISRTILDSRNPFKDYAIGKISIGTLKSENNDDLYYRMITPPDFDPAKKYPVFFYVYGGPHLQMVTDDLNSGATFWDLRWAQRGYIVFSMDNRGTPNRGADFEQGIHRRLGQLEVVDQMVGVDFLRSLPYVDANRMAVDGWSYGGFMTTSLMLKRPGTFKVAVAGGPVIDWKWYEVMYGERYMDTPQENPEGYNDASVLNYLDQLEEKLLIIHDLNDPVVVLQNSLSFIQESVNKGVQVDFFTYPGHEHNVRGIDRAHLYKKIEDYIDSVLKP